MEHPPVLSDEVLDWIAPVNPTEERLEVEDIERAERELVKKNPNYTPLFINK